MNTGTIEEDEFGRQVLVFDKALAKELEIDDDTCFSFNITEEGVTMTKLTPQEICDYKFKWLNEPHFESTVHIDLRYAYKDWLKFWCSKHTYDIGYFSDVYFDTVHFEDEQDFLAFNKMYSELQDKEEEHLIR